jgi:hypothetical protein
MTFLRSRHPLALACCLALIAAGAQAQSAPALQAQYANLQHALAQSPFQRPMVLRANASTEAPHGNVYAIVNHPFSAVGSAFQRPAHWCDVLMLQLNVKRCEVTGGDAQPQLNVAIGKKVDQPLKDAIRVAFDYTVQAAQSDYLSVQINAPDGPLGTHDYLLKLEAVPVDAQRSFLHMSYSYQNGLAARLATSAYLATSGRNKVGFTIAANSGWPTGLRRRCPGRGRAQCDALLPRDRGLPRRAIGARDGTGRAAAVQLVLGHRALPAPAARNGHGRLPGDETAAVAADSLGHSVRRAGALSDQRMLAVSSVSRCAAISPAQPSILSAKRRPSKARSTSAPASLSAVKT